MVRPWGVLICGFLALPVVAQDRLQPDFTFKRVRPPAPDYKGPRINVQITPEERAAPEAAPATGIMPEAGGHWFWSRVEAAEGAAARTRLALDLIDSPAAFGQPTPSLAHLQPIAAAYERAILAASIGTKVSPALALAVIWVESGGDPAAVSSAGAQGLMQLIPATAERFGVEDAGDPAQNIAGGIAYLDWLLAHFGGDIVLALAGYNAGEGAVRDHGGVPPYAETRAYVPKVLLAWKIARGLCQTPPQLPSDGCVFIRAKE